MGVGGSSAGIAQSRARYAAAAAAAAASFAGLQVTDHFATAMHTAIDGIPEAQPLLEPDVESPAAPSPRPRAYSDAIERLREFKQDPEQLQVANAPQSLPPPARPPPAPGNGPADITMQLMPGCCLVSPHPSPPLLQRLLAHTPTISRKQRRSLHAYYLRQNELIDALLQTEQIHRGLYTNDAHRVRNWGSEQIRWRWGGLQPRSRRPQRHLYRLGSHNKWWDTPSKPVRQPCHPTAISLPQPPPQEEAQVRRALVLSFAANCVLLVVRTALALLSGSLSLVIATLDAVLDVLSSIMLYWSAHQAKQRNKCELNGRAQVLLEGHRWPALEAVLRTDASNSSHCDDQRWPHKSPADLLPAAGPSSVCCRRVPCGQGAHGAAGHHSVQRHHGHGCVSGHRGRRQGTLQCRRRVGGRTSCSMLRCSTCHFPAYAMRRTPLSLCRRFSAVRRQTWAARWALWWEVRQPLCACSARMLLWHPSTPAKQC